MAKKEKVRLIMMLFFLSLTAYVSNMITHNKLLASLVQIPIPFSYFRNYYLGYRAGFIDGAVAKGVTEGIRPIDILGLVLHSLFVSIPMIPIFSFSLAIGNILSLERGASTPDVFTSIYASIVLVCIACVSGIVVGELFVASKKPQT